MSTLLGDLKDIFRVHVQENKKLHVALFKGEKVLSQYLKELAVTHKNLAVNVKNAFFNRNKKG